MSTESDPSALDPYYRAAKEAARELVTLIKVAEEHGDGADPGGRLVRGQVRQLVRGQTPSQTWLLVEVLARSVAAIYDDLDDWSAFVIQAIAEEDV